MSCTLAAESVRRHRKRCRQEVGMSTAERAGGAAAAGGADRGDASEFTRALNDELLAYLPFEDRQDFEDASRGLIAPLKEEPVANEAGGVAWDTERFSFIRQRCSMPADGQSE